MYEHLNVHYPSLKNKISKKKSLDINKGQINLELPTLQPKRNSLWIRSMETRKIPYRLPRQPPEEKSNSMKDVRENNNFEKRQKLVNLLNDIESNHIYLRYQHRSDLEKRNTPQINVFEDLNSGIRTVSDCSQSIKHDAAKGLRRENHLKAGIKTLTDFNLDRKKNKYGCRFRKAGKEPSSDVVAHCCATCSAMKAEDEDADLAGLSDLISRYLNPGKRRDSNDTRLTDTESDSSISSSSTGVQVYNKDGSVTDTVSDFSISAFTAKLQEVNRRFNLSDSSLSILASGIQSNNKGSSVTDQVSDTALSTITTGIQSNNKGSSITDQVSNTALSTITTGIQNNNKGSSITDPVSNTALSTITTGIQSNNKGSSITDPVSNTALSTITTGIQNNNKGSSITDPVTNLELNVITAGMQKGKEDTNLFAAASNTSMSLFLTGSQNDDGDVCNVSYSRMSNLTTPSPDPSVVFPEPLEMFPDKCCEKKHKQLYCIECHCTGRHEIWCNSDLPICLNCENVYLNEHHVS